MMWNRRKGVIFAIGGGLLAPCITLHLAAQGQPSPITITRIFTGRDNRTHSEQVQVKFVPALDGTEQSDFKVTNLRFFRWRPGHVNDWHPAPQKQYVITLSGRGEVEIGDGEKIAMEPGRIILAEDVTGKGHITRTIGNEVWVRVTIPLADQR